MVSFTKLGKTFSTKTFLDGKTTCGHKMFDNLWSQMDATIFIGKKPLDHKQHHIL
jgi:hypothetical protein